MGVLSDKHGDRFDQNIAAYDSCYQSKTDLQWLLAYETEYLKNLEKPWPSECHKREVLQFFCNLLISCKKCVNINAVFVYLYIYLVLYLVRIRIEKYYVLFWWETKRLFLSASV